MHLPALNLPPQDPFQNIDDRAVVYEILRGLRAHAEQMPTVANVLIELLEIGLQGCVMFITEPLNIHDNNSNMDTLIMAPLCMGVVIKGTIITAFIIMQALTSHHRNSIMGHHSSWDTLCIDPLSMDRTVRYGDYYNHPLPHFQYGHHHYGNLSSWTLTVTELSTPSVWTLAFNADLLGNSHHALQRHQYEQSSYELLHMVAYSNLQFQQSICIYIYIYIY